jgi:hypothetical protein
MGAGTVLAVKLASPPAPGAGEGAAVRGDASAAADAAAAEAGVPASTTDASVSSGSDGLTRPRADTGAGAVPRQPGIAFLVVQFPWGRATLHYPTLLASHPASALPAVEERQPAAAAAAAAAVAPAGGIVTTPAKPHSRRRGVHRGHGAAAAEEGGEEEEDEAAIQRRHDEEAAAAERQQQQERGGAEEGEGEGEGAEVIHFNSVRVITQCVVQLELIAAVGVLAGAHLASLRERHVHVLLQLLQGSADFARRFNADRPLRRALWESGFMRFARANKLPSLLRQETAATHQLLLLLLRLYSSGAGAGAGPAAAWRALALRHLQALSERMVARYAQLAIEAERGRMLATPAYMHGSLSVGLGLSGSAGGGGTGGARGAFGSPSALSRGRAGTAGTAGSGGAGGEGEEGGGGIAHLLDGSGHIDRDLFREAAAYGPLVGCLLEGLMAFDDAQFAANLHWLYPLLTGLVIAGSLEIRALVAGVLEERVRPLLPGAAAAAAPAAAAAAR